MKRQAVLLLSTFMAFSLAACGGAPSSKTTTEKTEAAVQETAPASDAA
ncbi:hypothetical protein [Lacrimispora saccharolytica]|nr:hypothetical protein [Lacrimispora saccharolytica]